MSNLKYVKLETITKAKNRILMGERDFIIKYLPIVTKRLLNFETIEFKKCDNISDISIRFLAGSKLKKEFVLHRRVKEISIVNGNYYLDVSSIKDFQFDHKSIIDAIDEIVFLNLNEGAEIVIHASMDTSELEEICQLL